MLSYKSVHTADIDEYAVVGNRLYLALDGRTDDGCLEEVRTLNGSLFGGDFSY